MSCMFKHAVNALPIDVCMWMYFLLKFKYMDIYEKISYQFSPKILFRVGKSVTPQIFGGQFFFFFFIQEFNVLLFYIPKIYETILF